MLVFGLQRWKCSIVSKVQQIDHNSFTSDVAYAITWTLYVNPASVRCIEKCIHQHSSSVCDVCASPTVKDSNGGSSFGWQHCVLGGWQPLMVTNSRSLKYHEPEVPRGVTIV